MSRVMRLLDQVAGVAVLAAGVALIAAAARIVLAAGAPPWLEPLSGAWIDDGWSRMARAAVALATGLAFLGIVRVPGRRRLVAAALLLVAGTGVSVAAGALDLVVLWGGLAVAHVAVPLALVAADERRSAARHALAVLLLSGLSSGALAVACLALSALSGSTHLVDIGFLAGRMTDAAPLALTALRTAVVAAALLAAWAPFHLGLPELWGEGSAPLAGWLAIAWPWAGWGLIVRLSGGLAPALAEWGFDAAAASTLFLALGALLPALAALAEERAGRLLALLAIGTLGEILLAVHGSGVEARVVASSLWGYGLAWIVSSAALAGARAAAGGDRLDTLAGLGRRAPRTALALAVAALLWAGLPGSFTLLVRGELWREAFGDQALAGLGAPLLASGLHPGGAISALALFVVTVGGLLRLFAAARLLRLLYFRSPTGADEGAGVPVTPPVPAAGYVPGVRSLWLSARWGLVFLAALALQFALGLGPAAWRVPFLAWGAPSAGG